MTENRVPRGVPTGGQFAASAHSEAEVSLIGQHTRTIEVCTSKPEQIESYLYGSASIEKGSRGRNEFGSTTLRVTVTAASDDQVEYLAHHQVDRLCSGMHGARVLPVDEAQDGENSQDDGTGAGEYRQAGYVTIAACPQCGHAVVGADGAGFVPGATCRQCGHHAGETWVGQWRNSEGALIGTVQMNADGMLTMSRPGQDHAAEGWYVAEPGDEDWADCVEQFFDADARQVAAAIAERKRLDEQENAPLE